MRLIVGVACACALLAASAASAHHSLALFETNAPGEAAGQSDACRLAESAHGDFPGNAGIERAGGVARGNGPEFVADQPGRLDHRLGQAGRTGNRGAVHLHQSVNKARIPAAQ